jgi:hypothetical protein
LLQDVVDRATFICENFGDAEVAYEQMRDLYWSVLTAIANGQCEDASPKEFAAAAIGLEAYAADLGGCTEEYVAELRAQIAGKVPRWLEPPEGPPPGEQWHAPRTKRKKPPKVRARKPANKPPRKTPKKRK